MPDRADAGASGGLTPHASGCPRRRVAVRSIVLVYVVSGILWIFGSGPVAGLFTEATSIPRWVVALGKGELFVAITALVLRVVLQRGEDRLDAVAGAADEGARLLSASEDRKPAAGHRSGQHGGSGADHRP